MAGRLIAPRELPDGSVSWDEAQPEIAARLHSGDPTLGWLGDDRLNLVLTPRFRGEDGYEGPRWEVWRRNEDGSASLVLTKRGWRLDGPRLLRMLAEHDSRTRDMLDSTRAANAAAQADRDRRFDDVVEGNADRLAHALGRDLSVPAQDGRLYPLGG